MCIYRIKELSIYGDAKKQVDACLLKLKDLWQSLPNNARLIISAFLIIECVLVFISLIRSIYYNRNNWAKRSGTNLTYSYFYRSGQHQRRAIYRDAFCFLLERKNSNWSNYSIARIAFLMGNRTSESVIYMFAISLAYIPLAAIGMVEEVVRFLIAVIPYTLLSICYALVLVVGWIINFLLIPFFKMLDRRSSIPQYCPSCYSNIKVPYFFCNNPTCGKPHNNLVPGVSGLLWAKCDCGRFIPCSSLSSRKKLRAYCPKCECILPSGNITTLDIQVIGSDKSGKSSYIQAFSNCYSKGLNSNHFKASVPVQPTELPVTEVCPHYFFNDDMFVKDEGVVLREIADEYIMSGDYKQSPIYYSFCDGITIIIDPQEDATSYESSEKIIANFIDQYSRYTARKANRRSNVPVAVVIVKADLPDILQQIGPDKISQEFSTQYGKYKTLSAARDDICRNFLLSIDLGNALLNLEAVFTKVAYFPVSSINYGKPGDSFMAKNVLEPILWIAQNSGSTVQKRITNALEE